MREDRRALTPRNDPVAEALKTISQWLDAAVVEASNLNAWVDVATAARMLNLSTSMVTALCRKGDKCGGLAAQKIGGEWRIARTSVERSTGR